MVIKDKCAKRLLFLATVAVALSAWAEEPAWVDIKSQIRPEVVASDSSELGSTIDTWWHLDFVVQGVKRGLRWIIR